MPEKFGAGVYWITPVGETSTEPLTGLLAMVTLAGSSPRSSVSLASTWMSVGTSSKRGRGVVDGHRRGVRERGQEVFADGVVLSAQPHPVGPGRGRQVSDRLVAAVEPRDAGRDGRTAGSNS